MLTKDLSQADAVKLLNEAKVIISGMYWMLKKNHHVEVKEAKAFLDYLSPPRKRAPTKTIVPAHEKMRLAKVRGYRPTADTSKEHQFGRPILPIIETPRP